MTFVQPSVENHRKVTFVSGDSTGATDLPVRLGSVKATKRKPIPVEPPIGGTSGESEIPRRTYAQVVQKDVKGKSLDRKSAPLAHFLRIIPS